MPSRGRRRVPRRGTARRAATVSRLLLRRWFSCRDRGGSGRFRSVVAARWGSGGSVGGERRGAAPDATETGAGYGESGAAPLRHVSGVAAIAVTGGLRPVGAQVDVSPSTVGMPGAGCGAGVGLVDAVGVVAVVRGDRPGGGGLVGIGVDGQLSGASRGKQFVLGGAVGALVIGLGPTMVNLLFNAGQGG